MGWMPNQGSKSKQTGHILGRWACGKPG